MHNELETELKNYWTALARTYNSATTLKSASYRHQRATVGGPYIGLNFPALCRNRFSKSHCIRWVQITHAKKEF